MADEHKHEHKGEHSHGMSTIMAKALMNIMTTNMVTAIGTKRMATTTGTSHDHSHEHDAHASRTRPRTRACADEHGHDHDHGHSHGHDHKTRFHDPAHAAEFDQRGMSDMRSQLTNKLIEALTLKGGEADSRRGDRHRARRPAVVQSRCKRPHRRRRSRRWRCSTSAISIKIRSRITSKAPAKRTSCRSRPETFDRAFVSFSLHHFGNPAGVVGEVLRVLKNSGRFVVLDPIIEEAKDAVDIALEAKINQVFRRTHGESFRFHTASSIQRLLTKAGYRVPRSSVISYPFNQEGMDGIPTGRHWLEAALELEKEAPELAERMKKNYFTWHAHGDHAHVKGSFSYALITGVKPA